MPRWIDRFTEASLLGARRVGRLYGAFFLGLAIVLLYWSGRGLTAYAVGVRAAWSEPVACGAGLVAGLLSTWAGVQLVRRGIPRSRFPQGLGVSEELAATLDEALEVERTNPAAASHLLETYFAREAAATERRLRDLRARASYDLEAAVALRRELRTAVETNILARKDWLTTLPEYQRARRLTEIEADDGQLRSEVLQLDATIERLRLR